MTAVTFAEEMNVDYATVIRWLRREIVPGAELIEPVPGMKVWQIPESALKMERPLAGRKRRPREAAEASANGLPFEPPATTAKPARKSRAKKTAKKGAAK